MNIIEAIENRKSIRKFLDKQIDKEIISNIIKAGINAPSPKNWQPWKFVVVSGSSKEELINVINAGFENTKAEFGMILNDNILTSINAMIKVIKEAPVTIFVINTQNKMMEKRNIFRRFMELANIQSAAAAIENMLLASLEYGIGGVWITDIYFMINEIGKWLNTNKQILAAVALGYPAENSAPRQKKGIEELVEWR